MRGATLIAKVVPTDVSGSRLVIGTTARLLLLVLILFLAAPILSVLLRSLQDDTGQYVGFANYLHYLKNPSLSVSIGNTILVGLITTVICVPLSFAFAYCLTHTCMPGKRLFAAVTMLPLLAPSLLPAMSFVYMFGRQGILRDWFPFETVYGPQGICLTQIFYCFPSAVMILTVALGMNDGRLYEASQAMGASGLRTFWRVTLPASRFGLVNACFVVFTLVTTDFGAPKIIGGNFGVLSTDIYKQVVGQQNFEMGAVIGVVLLLPTILAFAVTRWLEKRHRSVFSSRSTIHRPQRSVMDAVAFAFCLVISALICLVIAIAGWASFVKFWPYDLSLSLNGYMFQDVDLNGWASYFNSLELSLLVTVIGTAVIFVGAYIVEKHEHARLTRLALQFLAMLPIATPGLILGLGYIIFFNDPANPLSPLFGGIAIMVVNTIVHFYTVPHITGITALKKIDREFDLVSDSLRASRLMAFRRVTVPLCGTTIVDIASFLFVNSMTTVAALIFLYTSDTKTAAIAAINMDDSGMPASAIAMGMMVFYTSAAARLLHLGAVRLLDRRIHRWRDPSA